MTAVGRRINERDSGEEIGERGDGGERGVVEKEDRGKKGGGNQMAVKEIRKTVHSRRSDPTDSLFPPSFLVSLLERPHDLP